MNKNLIRRFVIVAVLLAIVVVMLGAYTRLTDAGLGCPDWPGCYGFASVPKTIDDISQAEQAFPERPLEPHKAWNEMIHRYFASTLGFLILVIFLGSITKQQLNKPRKLPLLLLLLVMFQGALGMWTVTMNLMPLVVMGHLLGGFTTLTLLYLLFMRLSRETHLPIGDPNVKQLMPFVILGFMITVIQIGLGAWTAANYAAVACTSLPICEGDWSTRLNFLEAFSVPKGHDNYEFGVMSYEARMTIHVTHRIGAIITICYLLWLSFRLLKQAHSAVFKRLAWILATVVSLQFLLGVGNVVLKLPISIAVTHNIVAAILILVLSTIIYSIARKA